MKMETMNLSNSQHKMASKKGSWHLWVTKWNFCEFMHQLKQQANFMYSNDKCCNPVLCEVFKAELYSFLKISCFRSYLIYNHLLALRIFRFLGALEEYACISKMKSIMHR
jgi:hypothetical protein